MSTLSLAHAAAEAELAFASAERALEITAPGSRDHERARAALLRARRLVAAAYAARCEDARHGAGQLTISAQRAPTPEACEAGWQRAEAIAHGAAAFARAAARVAEAIDGDPPRASLAGQTRAAAARAQAACIAARRLIDERNHAYTFHTDRAFSFGEGWYLAAAGVLAGVAIQVEPAMPASAQAEHFLRAAGLGSVLQPYRPRPRANKQTTVIVARAFRAGAASAQRALRAAFLGHGSVAAPVAAWIDQRLSGVIPGRKVILWVRHGVHHPGRNTPPDEIPLLVARAARAGLTALLVGDALRPEESCSGAVDMTLFWKDPLFNGVDGRRAQLQFFEHLRNAHGVVGQVGVTTAGMDGPALMGLPTLYLTAQPNVRMREWVGAVPGYCELLREAGYLERLEHTLGGWGATARGVQCAPRFCSPPI